MVHECHCRVIEWMQGAHTQCVPCQKWASSSFSLFPIFASFSKLLPPSSAAEAALLFILPDSKEKSASCCATQKVVSHSQHQSLH